MDSDDKVIGIIDIICWQVFELGMPKFSSELTVRTWTGWTELQFGPSSGSQFGLPLSQFELNWTDNHWGVKIISLALKMKIFCLQKIKYSLLHFTMDYENLYQAFLWLKKAYK